MIENIFKFNSIYKPVFFSKCRYIDIWGGRGRGGSHFVTDYFLHKITQPEYFRGYFMRSILNDVRESLFRDFKDRLEEKEEGINEEDFRIDENKMVIEYLPTSNIIISKGFKKSVGSQTAKLKSIAGATHIAIEECEEISEEDFNTLDVSLRTIKAVPQIFRIFNPPEKNHWLIKNHYKLFPSPIKDYYIGIPNEDENLLSIFSTYLNNITNLDKVFIKMLERFETTNPDYYYSNVRGYIPTGKKGIIFKNYQFFKELPDKKFYRVYGMDFGYSPDPTVLIELSICNEQKELYIKEVHRQIEMSTEEIYTAIKLNNEDNLHEVICDNAEKREINALIAYGLNVFKSQKGAGSRTAGRDLIKQFKLFIHEDSKDYIEELQNHTWALDTNKMPTGKPIDGWDHGIDATVYALNYYMQTYGIWENN